MGTVHFTIAVVVNKISNRYFLAESRGRGVTHKVRGRRRASGRALHLVGQSLLTSLEELAKLRYYMSLCSPASLEKDYAKHPGSLKLSEGRMN